MHKPKVISMLAITAIAALLLAAQFRPVSEAAGAPGNRQAHTPGSAALPPLQGAEAVEQLKKQGLYSSLAEAMTAARYRVYADEQEEAEYYALNPAQRMSVKFVDGAMRLTIKQPLPATTGQAVGSKGASAKRRPDGQPRYRTSEASLRLVGAGYGQRMLAATGRPEMTADENRFSYQHQLTSDPSRPIIDSSQTAAITEWYENRATGIEHGFTLNQPPLARRGNEPLRVEIEFGGQFAIRAKESGKGLVLSDRRGLAVSYDHLKVIDAKGRELAAVMKVRGRRVSIEVADREAEYPVTIDPVIDTEVRKIQATDRESGDQFGFSVAISGDTAIVGATSEDTDGSAAGAAYIFERNAGGADNWGEACKIQASDRQAGDLFGISVAISGDAAIVGAYREDTGGSDAGAAYIFERNAGGADNWGEVRKVQASDIEAGDHFGYSVAISGDTAIVGAYFEDTGGTSAGAAYLFERNAGGADNWGEVRKIQASDRESGDQFGISVAISGDTAIVGAYLEDTGGSSAGAAYLFERNAGGADNWGEIEKILSSDIEAGDNFGYSVAINGDTAIVGARSESTGGDDAGAAYLFSRNAGSADNWGEVRKIQASDHQASGTLRKFSTLRRRTICQIVLR